MTVTGESERIRLSVASPFSAVRPEPPSTEADPSAVALYVIERAASRWGRNAESLWVEVDLPSAR
jgi:hypothetical protein